MDAKMIASLLRSWQRAASDFEKHRTYETALALQIAEKNYKQSLNSIPVTKEEQYVYPTYPLNTNEFEVTVTYEVEEED